MKRLVLRFVVALASFSMAWASVPAINTTVRDIRSLSRAEADRGRPVVFEATVTYFRPEVHDLFVQDGNAGIFIETSTSQNLTPGDRVRIKGTTHMGFQVNVVSNDITVIGHGVLPKPVRASFEQLIRGQFDSEMVTVRGVVHAADTKRSWGTEKSIGLLKVLTDGGYVEAEVKSADPEALKHLPDTEVEITGVDGGKFDGKMQLTGIVLRVESLTKVKVIKPAAVNPWLLPPTPMDQVLSGSNVKQRTRRVRVVGTVTYFEPGAALVLQSGDKSLLVKTQSLGPVHIGDWAQVTGFPDVNNGFLVLTGSEIQDTGVADPINPARVNSQDLRASKHIYDLVSIDGEVVTETRERSQDEYIVRADGQVFSVIYSHRVATDALPPLKRNRCWLQDSRYRHLRYRRRQSICP